MKFFVLGCNGMAGHVISLYLKENGHDVLGFARAKSHFVESIVGDARNLELIKEIIYRHQFDAIINCIGLLNQFAENDHENAVFLNSYFPHYLAGITTETNTKVIHISTDCVFSGKDGNYSENSLRDGITFYDRSKALGELEDEKNITFRNSIIGPDIKKNGIGLLNWFLQQNDDVNGYIKALWTGQTTLQLAKTIEHAVKQQIHGLYNMVPSYAISKYELLVLFNKYIRKSSIKIVPADTLIIDKSLVRTKYEGFDYQIPDYEVMMAELGIWMRDHYQLYPHYELI